MTTSNSIPQMYDLGGIKMSDFGDACMTNNTDSHFIMISHNGQPDDPRYIIAGALVFETLRRLYALPPESIDARDVRELLIDTAESINKNCDSPGVSPTMQEGGVQ